MSHPPPATRGFPPIQRRLTESYSKAVEQLASDKIDERLGGIYTLEQISKESQSRYWTVMETLAAFVREHARWKEPDPAVMESMARYFIENSEREDRERLKPEPPTDIAAVLTVICRRDEKNYDREKKEKWRFDLRGVDLRDANLMDADLERAFLGKAHLEGADLFHAHLEGAILRGAYLEGANLWDAHLEGADLSGAHLEGTIRLTMDQLQRAHGDAKTRLPKDVLRPAHWPP